MEKKPFMTSLALDPETRRRIDDLRQARARAAGKVPPSMRQIITEAVAEYLDKELPFTS